MLKTKLKVVATMTALTAALVTASSANAALPGFYLGGQLGWGVVHDQGLTKQDLSDEFSSFGIAPVTISTHDSGLAGRVFAGYQIDPTWGFELGYQKFSNVKTSGSATGLAYGFPVPVSVSANGSIRTYAVDLVAKGTYELQNGFGIYGKLGAAYLNENAKLNANVNVAGISVANFSASATEHKIFPTFGAGITYDVTSNLVADVGWTRIQKVGNSNNLSSTDMVTGGLTYHFA